MALKFSMKQLHIKTSFFALLTISVFFLYSYTYFGDNQNEPDSKHQEKKRPNILLIVADDLGTAIWEVMEGKLKLQIWINWQKMV